jgi:RNA polymerase sigma-70 factor (ECF subfamily)
LKDNEAGASAEMVMASGGFQMSVAHHPTVYPGERVGSLPDEQLIDLFLGRAGEEAERAFRTLVVRHGPMVLGVCRHILGQHQDAEDAFQATFVVLARKAGTIKDRRVLGRWLYEVAYRIAVRARTTSVKRRNLERQVVEMSVARPESEPGWNELRPVIHEEVSRLPEKYRTPVVLCYLEGKTNEEVAKLLRWPIGTVKGRLSRARELLRSRLTRRGLVLSAAFLATALSRETVFAEVVPPDLIDSSVRAAMRHANRGSATPARPRWLSPRGVLALKLGLIAGALIVAGALIASASGASYSGFVPFPTDWVSGGGPLGSAGGGSCHGG